MYAGGPMPLHGWREWSQLRESCGTLALVTHSLHFIRMFLQMVSSTVSQSAV